LYISNIKLRNIRCFKELELNFNVDSETPEWTMILGDNSSGKSTLLKAIALGLCKDYQATNILAKMPGTFIRNNSKDSEIKVSLWQINGTTCEIRSFLDADFNNNEIVIGQAINPRKDLFYPFDQIFVCAYGATRPTESSILFDDNKQKYLINKSVSSLFNDNNFLNLELYLQRLKNDCADKNKTANERKDSIKKYYYLINQIEKILDIENKDLLDLTKQGLVIGGIPISSLGDGYKSTLTWVLDMIGGAVTANRYSINANLQGIVIIDELERHLHPSWQRKIVSLLRKTFPKVQFITTTHSPLVAAGMADIDNGKILVCKEGNYDLLDPSNIKGLRADQILTSPIFGLETTRNIETEKTLDELEDLVLKEKLTGKDQNKKNELEKKLSDVEFETGETEEIRKEQKKLNELIKILSEKNKELENKIKLAQSLNINIEE